ncbi:hypothetical protein I3843_08G049700 [Carya illinoinensis]|nr:hypothetical protein I3843_08G049700 [Carya illinoinensis]
MDLSIMKPLEEGESSDSHSFAQLPRKGASCFADPHVTSSVVQLQADSSYPTIENNAQKPQVVNCQSDSLGVLAKGEQSSIPTQGLNKQQQQHLHFPPMYGNTGSNFHPYARTSVHSLTSSVKPQPHAAQAAGTTQGINTMDTPKFQRQNSMIDLKRVQGGSASHLANSSTSQQNLLEQENAASGILMDDALEKHPSSMGSHITSATSPARTPSTKPSIGQKKPLDTLGLSQPLLSKKQKVSRAFSDQSIEQLNDVTAVSGVNLREDKEQLFFVTKEDSQVSEASRRIVQEEEERLILQKAPLQKKLVAIMAKCGLKIISNDVEQCLSLERVRGLVSNPIRLSKQRADIEKLSRTVINSDVQHQIMTMNKTAREEWGKKQAEAERLWRLDEANKEEDDKTRTMAAKVAVRAAVGGDDMLSRWQLMAEQARQKREGGMDASGSQPGKDVSRKPPSTSVPPPQKAGAVKKSGRKQIIEVIAVLEREPQMYWSSLYDRIALMASLSKAGAKIVRFSNVS